MVKSFLLLYRFISCMLQIDSSGRYKQLLNGSLQIIGLYRKDTGVYICIAENGIGYPAQREYHLEVTGMLTLIMASLCTDEFIICHKNLYRKYIYF